MILSTPYGPTESTAQYNAVQQMMFREQSRSLAPTPAGIGDRAHEARVGEYLLRNPHMLEHLAFQSGAWKHEEDRMKRMEAKQLYRTIEQKERAEKMYFEKAHVEHFNAANRKYRENYNFAIWARSWSDEDIARITEQGLNAYEPSTLRRFTLSILGDQLSRQTEWRVSERFPTPEYKYMAEASNHLLKHFAQKNRWPRKKHWIWRDGIVGNRGVGGVRLDPKDPFGNVIIERYYPPQFMFDIASATDPELSECRYLSRHFYRSRAEMAALYPEQADRLRTFATGGDARHINDLDMMIRPSVKRPTSEMLLGDQRFDPMGFESWRDMVMCCEFYKRYDVQKHVVHDMNRGMTFSFDSKDQADAWSRAMGNFYWHLAVGNQTSFDDRCVSIALPRLEPIVEQQLWVGNEMLIDVQKTDTNKTPYEHFFAEFANGEFASFTEASNDDVRQQARAKTRMDEIGGSYKPMFFYNANTVPDMEPEEFEARMVTSRYMGINVPVGRTLDDVIKVIDGANPGTAANMIYDISRNEQMHYYGGPNAVGQQESSAESGRAVLARRSAAQLALIPHLDELDNFDRRIGERVLHAAQFVDLTYQRMVVDAKNKPVLAAAIDNGVQSIDDHAMILEVAETAPSASEKDARSQRIAVIMSQNPQMAAHWQSVFAKYSDVDATDLDEAMQSVNDERDYQRNLEMSEQAHRQEIERKKTDATYIDKMIKLEELKLAQLNLPKHQVAWKPETLGPQMQAELVNTSPAMEADGLGVYGDRAAKVQMDLEQTKEQLKMEKKYAPKPTASHKSTGKGQGKQTVMSAKDKAQRRRR